MSDQIIIVEAFDGIHIGHLILRDFMVTLRWPLLRVMIPCDTLVEAKRGEVTHTLQERRKFCELLFPGCEHHSLFDIIPMSCIITNTSPKTTAVLGFENCGVANAFALAHGFPMISMPIDRSVVSQTHRKLSLNIPLCPRDPKAKTLTSKPRPPPPPPPVTRTERGLPRAPEASANISREFDQERVDREIEILSTPLPPIFTTDLSSSSGLTPPLLTRSRPRLNVVEDESEPDLGIPDLESDDD